MKIASRKILEAYVASVIEGSITIEHFENEINEFLAHNFASLMFPKSNMELFKDSPLFEDLIPEHLCFTFFTDKTKNMLLHYVCLSLKNLKLLYSKPITHPYFHWDEHELIAQHAPKDCEKAQFFLPYYFKIRNGFCKETLIEKKVINAYYNACDFMTSTDFFRTKKGIDIINKHAVELYNKHACFETEDDYNRMISEARIASGIPQEIEDQWNQMTEEMKEFDKFGKSNISVSTAADGKSYSMRIHFAFKSDSTLIGSSTSFKDVADARHRFKHNLF